MLELRNIVKDYKVGDENVRALKGVTLAFRENEMVSILGQSGCGKTTLLNIIGGLDRYSDGDLIINGRSTKDFKAADWDAYRNRRIGFVFQSYNLIPHLSVLGNVELALTLSGVKKSERKRRAIEALKRVGLEKELKKRPNQMSGGQMQRVAIARAIVNNPDIILADEPTGALDSNTSVQVMEILKEIAADRLVIMVTHNRALAETYSTRIISMLDGEVTGDSSPFDVERVDNVIAEGGGTGEADALSKTAPASAEQKELKKRHKKEQKAITKSNKAAMRHTSMSFATAFGLSWRNLTTKKGRTVATAIAGSIGIIGVALVLALSNGFNNYIADMETSMLASYPVTVTQMTADIDSTMKAMESGGAKLEEFPDGNKLIVKVDTGMMTYHYNRITQDYLDFVDKMPAGLALDVTRDYQKTKIVLSDNIQTAAGAAYGRVETTSDNMMNNLLGMGAANFSQLLNNSDYVKSQYDVLEGAYPVKADEIAVVVGKDNAINKSTLANIGLHVPESDEKDAQGNIIAKLGDLIGQELKFVYNDRWFSPTGNGLYKSFDEKNATQEEWKALYDDPDNLTLKVVGVMRVKESAALALFGSGIVYTPELNKVFIEDCKTSEVGRAQIASKDMCVSDVFNLLSGQSGAGSSAGMKFDDMLKFTGGSFMGITLTKDDLYAMACQSVGASDIPSTLNFYPISFDKKTDMLAYLDVYNMFGRETEDKILPLDAASLVTVTVSDMIDIISYVLIAFAAISLLVSSVMISIITYASVAERIKEIGVLRAVGARKIDIMRVFNAETVLIGLAAGLIGVLITFILSFPLSSLFILISDGVVRTSLVSLAWWHAIVLVGISVLLTFIAGMLPSMSAAKRDPVVALRSE